jgi:hypothetical protein
MDRAKRTCRHGIKISNGKWKIKAMPFFLIRLPFARCANGSLLFVHWLMKKHAGVVRLQTD